MSGHAAMDSFSKLPLSPPKSLQGTENVDTIWEMITRRFPNVAPLLCEMEAVIDRTQDLLQHLRLPSPRNADVQDPPVPSTKERSRDTVEKTETDTNENSESFLQILNFEAHDGCQRLKEDKSVNKTNEEWDCGRSQGSTSRIGNVEEAEEEKEAGQSDGSGRFSVGSRDPWSILREYADRSSVEIILECTARPLKLSKTRRYIADGKLAHYCASAFGETVESAKNHFATKILRQVTFDEMRNESVAPLAKLTRQEILEVMNLPTEHQGTTETALTRLCRICLEKGQSLPVFNNQRCKTYEGLCLTVTCTALGYSGCGKAVSKSMAMKMAAQETYEKYCRGTIEASNHC